MPGTLRLGSSHAADATFIATTVANLHSPVSLTAYTASELTPAGGAEWVGISYGAFITETERLAAHRGLPENGGLTTAVIDVEEIVNQYGFGLRLPSAIRY